MAVDDDKTTPTLALRYKASLVTIQDSLKWLIATSGATAAFVIGGLQLGNVAGTAPLSTERGITLGVTAAIGLGAVFGLLVWATRILTLPRLTANDLCDREVNAKVLATGRIPGQVVKDELVTWILDQRTYLLGNAQTVQAVYMDEFIASRNALVDLRRGKPADWKDQTVYPSDADGRKRIEENLQEAERQLTIVEDATHFEQTRLAYRRLMKSFPYGAGILVVAIAVFAVASRFTGSDAPPEITKPTAVAVVVRDRSAAGLPTTCKNVDLNGVAVEGPLRTPTIVIDGPPECRGTVIEESRGVVVIPAPDSKAAP